jgi:trans-aconitate 2-methyltransferase
MSTCGWDGTSYDRISAIQQRWGAEVLERLRLTGDETVLDAGCGSGRVTQMLATRLPRGRVIAVDASPSMVEAARATLENSAGEGGAHVEVRLGNLLDLELAEPLDAVISTATFHWIADHEGLFRGMRAALGPGGRLVAQCGGEGNIERLRARARAVLAREPYAEHFDGWRAPWNYATAERTRDRLLAAGFASARCWLTPAPSEPEQPREFLSTIVLAPHVQQLPENLREPFMDEVMAVLGKHVVIDYVRLNIDASV